MNAAVANDTDAIARELCRYLESELLHSGVTVTPDTEFRSLDLDSYLLMELLLHLERTVGRTLSADALSAENLRSARSLSEYVCRR